MGNCMECLHTTRKPNDIYLDEIPHVNVGSTQSVTDFSEPSKKESVPGTVSKCSTESSASSKFSWIRLQNTYKESTDGNLEVVKIQPLVLTVMKEIFQVIENNIGPMSRRFNSCLTETDKAFPMYFEECIGQNYKAHIGDDLLNEKIRAHTIIMIHVHKIIVNLLDSHDSDKAYDIMKLIALSHILMKVTPSYFKYMDTVMGTFLIANGFLHEYNAQAIVIYLNSITNYICNYMNILQAKHKEVENAGSISALTNSTESESTSTSSTQPSLARENYRHMKRWHSLVHNWHEDALQLNYVESVNTLPPDKSSTSTVPTEVLKETAFIMKYFVKKKHNKTI